MVRKQCRCVNQCETISKTVKNHIIISEMNKISSNLVASLGFSRMQNGDNEYGKIPGCDKNSVVN